MTLEVVVGIPTLGRPEQLTLTLKQLGQQRRLPDRTVICPVNAEDFDEVAAAALTPRPEVVRSARGLSAQRNALLRAAGDADLLIFFDDDFYPAADYIEQAIRLFEAEPDVVVATHHPALDGASGRGVTHEEALAVVSRFDREPAPPPTLRPTYGGYGCNMVVRLAPVREHGVLFDENLPFYSWLEDIDFSQQLAPYGRIVTNDAFRGVHLGVKRGRTSGLRFGYSQVANPVYMLKKGSMSPGYALQQITRNVAKNTLRALWPEPWVDRAGRFKGNTIALRHWVTGRLHPLNVAELE